MANIPGSGLEEEHESEKEEQEEQEQKHADVNPLEDVVGDEHRGDVDHDGDGAYA